MTPKPHSQEDLQQAPGDQDKHLKSAIRLARAAIMGDESAKQHDLSGKTDGGTVNQIVRELLSEET